MAEGSEIEGARMTIEEIEARNEERRGDWLWNEYPTVVDEICADIDWLIAEVRRLREGWARLHEFTEGQLGVKCAFHEKRGNDE
jgi:hypothetical protein